MKVVRPLLACAIAAAASFAFASPADAVCASTKYFNGGACVYVDPNSPEPVRITCGGTNWTCA